MSKTLDVKITPIIKSLLPNNIRYEYEVIVPAGEYYLGDPCYCISNRELWEECCNQWLTEDWSKESPVANVKDSFVLAFNTKYGDGTYRDQYINIYGVDSGCIGLVPMNLVDCNPGKLSIKVNFTEDTLCTSKDGILTFGKYVINTSGNDDEDED